MRLPRDTTAPGLFSRARRIAPPRCGAPLNLSNEFRLAVTVGARIVGKPLREHCLQVGIGLRLHRVRAQIVAKAHVACDVGRADREGVELMRTRGGCVS